MAEDLVKGMVDIGINTIAVGGAISDLMLHYLDKYGLMVLRVPSKWELVRLCRLLNARAIATVKAPTKEDLGYCELV